MGSHVMIMELVRPLSWYNSKETREQEEFSLAQSKKQIAKDSPF